MKQIPISQRKNAKHVGLFAQVDDEDYDFLMQWKWTAFKAGNTFYAKRNQKTGNKINNVFMHRVILGVTNPKILGDHKDKNGLNCQRSNLRVANYSQNAANKIALGKSKYLGVSVYENRKSKYRATITKDGNTMNLGYFMEEIDAAKAYNKAALEHHKKFSNLNTF